VQVGLGGCVREMAKRIRPYLGGELLSFIGCDEYKKDAESDDGFQSN
jgi:hypothetical protein